MLSPSCGRFTVRGATVLSLIIAYRCLVGSGRPLPKCQRQGAIIILGMLALAKRNIVSERVDTLVKVGLGHLGKVRRLYFLAFAH